MVLIFLCTTKPSSKGTIRSSLNSCSNWHFSKAITIVCIVVPWVTMAHFPLRRSSAHFFFFFIFRAALVAYGSYQMRFNGSCSCQPTPHQCQVPALSATHTAHSNIGSLTHWVRPWIEFTSSLILVGFVTAEPWWELLNALSSPSRWSNLSPNFIIEWLLWRSILHTNFCTIPVQSEDRSQTSYLNSENLSNYLREKCKNSLKYKYSNYRKQLTSPELEEHRKILNSFQHRGKEENKLILRPLRNRSCSAGVGISKLGGSHKPGIWPLKIGHQA